MARKSVNFKISDDGRDKGKVFVITEMSARKGEEWAIKAILALMSGGVELPDGFEKFGMAGMAQIGIRALSNLRWDDAEPLLSEMWDCVTIMPDPKNPQIIRNVIDEDIEEVITRINIRKEVFNLHVDFLKAAKG